MDEVNKLKYLIVIISYNSAGITKNCINSVYSTCDFPVDICVVDNNSSDNTIELINKNFPDVKVIANSENLGYSKAVNIGVLSQESDYVIISNADVIYKPDSIKKMFEYLENNPKSAVIGPAQYYADGRLQYSHGLIPGLKFVIRNILYLQPILNRIKSIKPKKVQYLDGAVLACRSKAFRAVNGFSEDFFFYSEDADFCRKINDAGYECIHLPDAEVIHLRGASTNINGINENALDMFVKAKIKLTHKYCSPIISKLYFCSEVFNTRLTEILFKIIYSVKKSPKSLYKYQYYNKLLAVWKSNIKSLKNK